MNNDWTIKKLFEEICRIEVEHKLFEKKINGIYFWKLIRFNLFMELSQKLELYGEAHPLPEKTENRYIRVLKRLINGTLNGPMTAGKESEVVLFPHERKVNIDSSWIDIYSYHLEDEWRQNGTNFLVVDRPYNGKFIRKPSRIVRYDEPLNFFSLWSYFKPKKDIYTDSFINEIDTIANIPLGILKTLSKEYISSAVNNFKREYNYYNKILSNYSPKKLYIVNAYGKNSLIAAANDLKIDTIEIQHGTITSFHVGYSYPREVDIPYFPKKLSLWGEFWYNISQLPLGTKSITYDGFPFLDQEIEKYANIIRDEERVLFISQGPTGKLLVDCALEFAIKNKKFKVVYRLHPSEAEKWKTLYPKLYTSSIKNNNIDIETAIDQPLYKSLSKSKFVVGVSSTALIESLAVGCQLILVDLPGVEYFEDLTDKGLVQKVKNAEDLGKIVREDDKPIMIDSHYFFAKHREMNL